jgi:endonuclease IV
LSETYTIIAHNCYVSQPWSGNVEFILEQLEVCRRCGIVGFVLHLPKKCDNILPILAKMIVPGVKIYLETPAVIDSNYDTPEKINNLFGLIRQIDPHLTHFGICIDTAHLHVNGIILKSAKNMNDYLDGLQVPIENIMFHLNDSENALHVGPDKHAALLKGKIWAGDRSGLDAILRFIKTNNIPTILERDSNELYNHDFTIIN